MDSSMAWLAGLWDGEGSIGLVESRTTYILQLQMSMTHLPTIERVIEILTEKDIRVRGPYQYKERNPNHKDAVSIRISGLNNSLQMANLMIPNSVTKRRLWELARDWCTYRIAAAGGLDEQGHVKRGGAARVGYSDDERAVLAEIRAVNDSRRRVRKREDDRGV